MSIEDSKLSPNISVQSRKECGDILNSIDQNSIDQHSIEIKNILKNSVVNNKEIPIPIGLESYIEKYPFIMEKKENILSIYKSLLEKDNLDNIDITKKTAQLEALLLSIELKTQYPNIEKTDTIKISDSIKSEAKNRNEWARWAEEEIIKIGIEDSFYFPENILKQKIMFEHDNRYYFPDFNSHKELLDDRNLTQTPEELSKIIEELMKTQKAANLAENILSNMKDEYKALSNGGKFDDSELEDFKKQIKKPAIFLKNYEKAIEIIETQFQLYKTKLEQRKKENLQKEEQQISKFIALFENYLKYPGIGNHLRRNETIGKTLEKLLESLKEMSENKFTDKEQKQLDLLDNYIQIAIYGRDK